MPDPKFPSKLRGRAGLPTRGIGAGFAQNQRVAGAQDPEAAAQAAVSDPAELQAQMEQAAQLGAEVDEMREDLLLAVNEGTWGPPATMEVQEGEDARAFLARQPPNIIQKLHADLDEVRNELADQVDEDDLKGQIDRDLRPDPGDHLYEPIYDRQRRKELEKTLTPISFEDMIFQGYGEQTVPVRESFTLTLRTVPNQQLLWMEEKLGEYTNKTRQYVEHMLSLMRVAAALHAINSKPVGTEISHLKQVAHREEFLKALDMRLEEVNGYPDVVADELIVQCTWFFGRVRRTVSGNLAEKVGN